MKMRDDARLGVSAGLAEAISQVLTTIGATERASITVTTDEDMRAERVWIATDIGLVDVSVTYRQRVSETSRQFDLTASMKPWRSAEPRTTIGAEGQTAGSSYITSATLSVDDVTLTRPSGWSRAFDEFVREMYGH